MNQTVPEKAKFGFLKPIHEVYNGDDSEEGEEIPQAEPKENGFTLGMPATMSKTFDISHATSSVVPKLDFRKLKQVKETKDWYGYQEKLETNIKFLRDRVVQLEDTNKELNEKFNKVKEQNKKLYQVNQKMSQSLRKGNQRLNELKEKYTELNFEMTMPGGFGATYDNFDYVLTEES